MGRWWASASPILLVVHDVGPTSRPMGIANLTCCTPYIGSNPLDGLTYLTLRHVDHVSQHVQTPYLDCSTQV